MNETIKNGANTITRNTGISIAVVFTLGIVIIGAVVFVNDTAAKTQVNSEDIDRIEKNYMPREVLELRFDSLDSKLDILIEKK